MSQYPGYPEALASLVARIDERTQAMAEKLDTLCRQSGDDRATLAKLHAEHNMRVNAGACDPLLAPRVQLRRRDLAIPAGVGAVIAAVVQYLPELLDILGRQ